MSYVNRSSFVGEPGVQAGSIPSSPGKLAEPGVITVAQAHAMPLEDLFRFCYGNDDYLASYDKAVAEMRNSRHPTFVRLDVIESLRFANRLVE